MRRVTIAVLFLLMAAFNASANCYVCRQKAHEDPEGSGTYRIFPGSNKVECAQQYTYAITETQGRTGCEEHNADVGAGYCFMYDQTCVLVCSPDGGCDWQYSLRGGVIEVVVDAVTSDSRLLLEGDELLTFLAASQRMPFDHVVLLMDTVDALAPQQRYNAILPHIQRVEPRFRLGDMLIVPESPRGAKAVSVKD